MHTKTTNRIALVTAMVAALLPMTSMASFAQGNLISPTEWEKLSILNPNISLQEYEQQIIDWAKNNNQKPSEVVKQVLDEIKQGEEEEQKYKAAQLSRSKKERWQWRR